MPLRIARFIGLFSTGLLAGVTLAHVLELSGKLKLAPPTWLAVQQILYNLFGPVSGPIEVAAILSTLAVLAMVRGRRIVFALTLAASALLVAALVEWVAVVNPVNSVVNAWTPASLPADWTQARDRSQYGHAAHAGLVILALAALTLAVLVDAPADRVDR